MTDGKFPALVHNAICVPELNFETSSLGSDKRQDIAASFRAIATQYAAGVPAGILLLKQRGTWCILPKTVVA